MLGHDAFSYSLDYYDGDYTPIRTTNANGQANIQANDPPENADELYNGNITRMTTALRGIDDRGILPINPTRYKYDQLHRIKKAIKYRNIDLNNFRFNHTETNNYYSEYEYDANGNISTLTRNDENSQVIDRMRYTYDDPDNNNLLDFISDGPTATVGDFVGQESKNYRYDGSGNMIYDKSEVIGNIIWDHYGKIRYIERIVGTDLNLKPNMDYHYDPMGNRIVKIIKRGSGANEWTYTYYVRDASGNVMATYEGKRVNFDNPIGELYVREHHIYGSSRLGIKKADNPNSNLADDDQVDSNIATRISGLRQYELSNHLGNVLSTVSDNKLLTYQGNGVSLYQPEILSYSDYYPFGE